MIDKNANPIRVKKVQVKGLFNRFNYIIDVENEENVSVITAPNGCGKTTIFQFWEFLLHPKVETLLPIVRVPFASFVCYLSNNKTIEFTKTIVKDDAKTSQDRVPLAEQYLWTGFNFVIKHDRAKIEDGDFHRLLSKGNLNKKNRSDENDENDIDENYVSSLFADYLDSEPLYRRSQIAADLYGECKYVCDALQKSLKDNQCHVHVSFISANRLNPMNQSGSLPLSTLLALMMGSSIYPSSAFERNKNDVLSQASKYVADLIKKALDSYNEKLAEAKDELLSQFLREKKEDAEAYVRQALDAYKQRPEVDLELEKETNQLRIVTKWWNLYQERVNAFREIGLIQQPPSDVVVESAFANRPLFLILYLQAFEKTLDPLEDVYSKLKLFQEIINGRNDVTEKTLNFRNPTDNEFGIFFVVQTDSNEQTNLDIHRLSSGEKHDLVMFYNLIFKATPGGILLVDEPEISWHIDWQIEYLDHLINICRKNNLQAIVATHSPHILHERKLAANWEVSHVE